MSFVAVYYKFTLILKKTRKKRRTYRGIQGSHRPILLHYQARIQRRSARPPLFVPNFLKSPLNWPKKSWSRAPDPPAVPPFSNPG